MFSPLSPPAASHETPWTATCSPCPSLSPGGCSNSGPLSQWCYPAIASSAFLLLHIYVYIHTDTYIYPDHLFPYFWTVLRAFWKTVSQVIILRLVQIKFSFSFFDYWVIFLIHVSIEMLPTLVRSWRKQGSSRKTSTFASLTMLNPLTVWITTLWNILKEMGISDHLICTLRNVYASQEATVRTEYGKTDWFKIGNGVWQGCILSLWLFNLYVEYIMWNADLDESQAGIKIAGRNINNLRYAEDTTQMAEGEEELKGLLMKIKERLIKLT